jgi:Coenzyme PQQ synthesis protein D (PqqD)
VDLTIDSVLVQDGEQLSTSLDDQVVVLSIRAGTCFGFNRVGRDIWNMLAEPNRVGDICDKLSNLYDVDAATAMRDVGPFLQNLIARRLVRAIDPGGAK